MILNFQQKYYYNKINGDNMEYIYAAMILHTTKQDINEENVTKILEAAGADVDESRVKALIAALEDVDIEEAMETTAMAAAQKKRKKKRKKKKTKNKQLQQQPLV